MLLARVNDIQANYNNVLSDLEENNFAVGDRISVFRDDQGEPFIKAEKIGNNLYEVRSGQYINRQLQRHNAVGADRTAEELVAFIRERLGRERNVIMNLNGNVIMGEGGAKKSRKNRKSHRKHTRKSHRKSHSKQTRKSGHRKY